MKQKSKLSKLNAVLAVILAVVLIGVYNGFGIVTTGLHPTDLIREEEKLYNLIVKRVIDAFAPDTCGKGRKPKGDKMNRRRKNRKNKGYKAKTVKTA